MFIWSQYWAIYSKLLEARSRCLKICYVHRAVQMHMLEAICLKSVCVHVCLRLTLCVCDFFAFVSLRVQTSPQKTSSSFAALRHGLPRHCFPCWAAAAPGAFSFPAVNFAQRLRKIIAEAKMPQMRVHDRVRHVASDVCQLSNSECMRQWASLLKCRTACTCKNL